MSSTASINPCTICGFLCGGEIGDICPVCWWENEGRIDDPDLPSAGPNYDLSVTQAQKNFAEFGAVEIKGLAYVVPPKLEWIPEVRSTDIAEQIGQRQTQARKEFKIRKIHLKA